MLGSTDELQADIERLYALPLDQFTPARDQLARRLRGDGDRDAAAEVKRLLKPNLAAWALNQVRHRDPSIVEALVVAGERLEQAQQQLVAGGAVRGALQNASAEERRAVEALVSRGEQELTGAGHPIAAALQSKLRATAHAAAVSPEPRELLRAGRLLRDHELSGLGLGLGSEPAAGGEVAPARPRNTRTRPGRTPDPQPRTRTSRGRTDGTTERETTDRQNAAREAAAREAAERAAAERRARAIGRELERARARHEKLAVTLTEAEHRAAEARRQATKAATEFERAEARAEQAGAKAAAAAGRVGELEAELRTVTADMAAVRG